MAVVSLRKVLDEAGFTWVLKFRDRKLAEAVLRGAGPTSAAAMLPPNAALELERKHRCIEVRRAGGLNRELVPAVAVWKPERCSEEEFWESVEALLDKAEELSLDVYITAEERIVFSGAVRSDERGVFIEISKERELRALTSEGKIYASFYAEYEGGEELGSFVLKHPGAGELMGRGRGEAARAVVHILGLIDKDASAFISRLFFVADRLRRSSAKRFVIEAWYYDERGYLSSRYRGAVFDIDFY